MARNSTRLEKRKRKPGQKNSIPVVFRTNTTLEPSFPLRILKHWAILAVAGARISRRSTDLLFANDLSFAHRLLVGLCVPLGSSISTRTSASTRKPPKAARDRTISGIRPSLNREVDENVRRALLRSYNKNTGLYNDMIVGPYFLPDRLTSTEFLNFLKNELSYLLEDVPLYSVQRMWMQLDGCPAHYGTQIRQWLNNRFPQRWIGRGGSIPWPPRSPDLTPLDFYLWETLKDKVYQTRINSRHELIEKINNAFNEMKENRNEIRTVTNSIFDRCQSCIVNNGRHFEI
ncbi:hypothetical protein ANTPLA_LOCUS4888 [Anthophora plagiata]